VTLGVLSEQGGSIQNLAASGQARRFIDQYLARYAEAFDRVYYFSYGDEAPTVPDGCTVVPNRWRLQRWFYAFLMPFLQARSFRACSVLRVMQLTGEVPAILAKLAYGIPFIVTYGYEYAVHAAVEGAGPLRVQAFRMRTRVALAFADRVIVTNPRIRANVERRIGAARVLFVPNAVDTELFSPAPFDEEPEDPPRIVFVGRLSPQKNLAMLIDAAARLGRPVVVRLVGGGPLAGDLSARAAAAGVPLELPGVLPNEELPGELRRASVFVLPSSIEGHPKSLIEAMSCGCVCVGTDVEGTRDVLENGVTGLLARPTVDDLVVALERALEDRALRARLSANARAFVVQHYDIAATLATEVRALRSLAGQRHGS
jgi:glycosyltransferase involved in cell wall biosynthesis